MMKSTFQEMLAFIEPRLEEKPRGFELFTKELLSSMVRVYDDDVKTVYVSGYAFPTELLWGFDVVPFDFEIAVAVCGFDNHHTAIHRFDLADNDVVVLERQ